MGDDWARPVVHWEIEARDPNVVSTFYRELFNWQVGNGDIRWIPAGLGGPEPGPAGHIRGGETSRVSLYVQVRDLKRSLERVAELGGTALSDPFDVPDGPTMAVAADPEGNTLMLVQQ